MQLVNQLKPVLKPTFGYSAEEPHTISERVMFNPINSPELYDCYNSLKLAKAWYGKMLGKIGTPSPYTNDGKRKDVSDIEPTADRTYTNYSEKLSEQGLDWGDMNHAQRVDWLRQQIGAELKNCPDIAECYKKQVDVVEQQITIEGKDLWMEEYEKQTSKIPDLFGEGQLVYQYLCEARFHLGFELEQIRNENIKL